MSTNTLEAPGMKAVAAASKLSVPRYGNLLKRFAPKVIETPEENRLALQIVERLMSIGDGRRSAEESALLSLRGSGRAVRAESRTRRRPRSRRRSCAT